MGSLEDGHLLFPATSVGIAAKNRNMSSEMTPEAVTRLPRYSWRDSPASKAHRGLSSYDIPNHPAH
jgi:hypothetical protein